MKDSTYTAVLWGKENDANSIVPLEATGGDYEYWTHGAGVDTPEYRRILKDNTGLSMTIFEGDVPIDAPWGGTDKSVLENAYVDRAWNDKRVAQIAARLMGTKPANITVKRAS